MRAYRNTLRGFYGHLTASRKYKGIEVLFSFEEFQEWYIEQRKICSYCEISEEDATKLGMPWKYKFQKFLSIDRIDATLPYSLENICLCCRACNMVKANILSGKEMKEIAMRYIRPKWAVIINEKPKEEEKKT